MAAEIIVLNEITEASIDEELLLDYEEDGEFHLISATAAFMKRDLKRIEFDIILIKPLSQLLFSFLFATKSRVNIKMFVLAHTKGCVHVICATYP